MEVEQNGTSRSFLQKRFQTTVSLDHAFLIPMCSHKSTNRHINALIASLTYASVASYGHRFTPLLKQPKLLPAKLAPWPPPNSVPFAKCFQQPDNTGWEMPFKSFPRVCELGFYRRYQSSSHFETVTLAFQGEVEHHDSSGNTGIIGAGDVQWMAAGRGIIHEEYYSKEFTKSGGRDTKAY
jgi:hypothetical protein